MNTFYLHRISKHFQYGDQLPGRQFRLRNIRGHGPQFADQQRRFAEDQPSIEQIGSQGTPAAEIG